MYDFGFNKNIIESNGFKFVGIIFHHINDILMLLHLNYLIISTKILYNFIAIFYQTNEIQVGYNMYSILLILFNFFNFLKGKILIHAMVALFSLLQSPTILRLK